MSKINSYQIESAIEIISAVKCPWKDLFVRQLQAAELSIEEYDDACFLLYSVSQQCDPILGLPRVPLTVLIDFGMKSKNAIYYQDPHDVPLAYGNSGSPIECNVHIIDGYLHEIEIFTVDGTNLPWDQISDGRAHYVLRTK